MVKAIFSNIGATLLGRARLGAGLLPIAGLGVRFFGLAGALFLFATGAI
jgi:hypothetical protein